MTRFTPIRRPASRFAAARPPGTRFTPGRRFVSRFTTGRRPGGWVAHALGSVSRFAAWWLVSRFAVRRPASRITPARPSVSRTSTVRRAVGLFTAAGGFVGRFAGRWGGGWFAGARGSVSRFVVIHDGSCGGCSAIAARLRELLAVPVAVRSCRDPHLAAEFPVLAGRAGCARPLAVVIGRTGAVEVLYGVRLLWRGATLVAPGRRVAALTLAWRILRLRLVRRP